MNRYQKGQLIKKHRAWHVRYYGQVQTGEEPVWREKSKQIGRIKDYPRTQDIQPVFDDFMAEINRMYGSGAGTPSLSYFIEHNYLKSDAVKELAKSTLDGYNDIFECHLKETLRSETLGGLTTSAARGLLEQIAADNELRKRTIANIKHFLSGVYTFARNHGHFNGANPITGLKLKIKRRDTPTFAYSLDYQRQMLAAVQLKPRAAMAIAGYAGLSRSELQGLRWEDRQDHELSVQRSVVEGVEKETKTEHRAAPVPIISELAIILDDYWNSLGRPKQGWMFPAGRGKNSMSMSNLYRRHIIDDLRKHNIPWHGWHAFRRGLATNLKEMGVDDMVIQRILRHGTAETTRKHYIKLLSPSVKKAMSRLDRKLKRDKHGTVKNDAA